MFFINKNVNSCAILVVAANYTNDDVDHEEEYEQDRRETKNVLLGIPQQLKQESSKESSDFEEGESSKHFLEKPTESSEIEENSDFESKDNEIEGSSTVENEDSKIEGNSSFENDKISESSGQIDKMS